MKCGIINQIAKMAPWKTIMSMEHQRMTKNNNYMAKIQNIKELVILD